MANSLLIIEDDVAFGRELKRHFAQRGWDVELATTLAEARKAVLEDNSEPLVIIADMSLPDGNALDLLEQARAAKTPGEWILFTGYGSVPDSVRALRLGAYDFLEKPCPISRLELVVAGARRSGLAQRRLHFQGADRSRRYTPESYIGTSEITEKTRQMIAKLAQVPFSALILGGETGTGKGLVARILHHSGPRADGPMVEVNCAALPRELLESQLFGHEAGAFTGAKGRHRGYMEQAHEGTLFLDEIAEMDLELQTKLLTVLEDRRLRRLGAEKTIDIDVQIIAASNRNLDERVSDGSFRSDLFHRLSVFRLELPPLRERLDDLEQLVPALIDEYNARSGRRVRQVPTEVYRLMRDYDWPGNVRELRNVIERAVLLAEDDVFPVEWMQLGHGARRPSSGPDVDGNRLIIPLDGSMALDEMDSYIIRTALERTSYNVTAAARALGTTRETLRYRVQKYGLIEGRGKDGDAAEAPPADIPAANGALTE
ncbi:response regulator with CheY-like receiver, AAA-type ATPase, and DNA-binding domains [Thioflavicoccus mobilis 8321]|uniref:Response regulator with CheY-like receiver, AAA-type ATPase, and DNA-binding domains n=1 Tax=Thioflavicoccus mobilis 8321 TaxID=765912 RepID=L0GTV7_9GAMM|nr:sigma-54 dependent transcriptional regulator [Thioflavicoccus mobilis]AGA90193.1 response regulator with CheY-like receiver, AAA-type ATPase, and DNA-binding domains [Thioflavicoccus mobilis 8321]